MNSTIADNLDHREPVLERAEVADRARVHVEQDEREGERPDPHRHVGKPERHVDAGGDRFAADGDHLRDPIRVADDETRPGIEIGLRVHAERARCRMNDRHLRQAEDHDQRDEAGDGIAQHHRWPGIADGDAAAHEQPGADRAAEADHDHLGAGQGLVETVFAVDGLRHWLTFVKCLRRARSLRAARGPGCLRTPQHTHC